ncbi:MAG TPA: NosD domain-containing protein [Terriglobales bacterium]|nr:NosD domain-containing protein [Terriglobales bacterium]
MNTVGQGKNSGCGIGIWDFVAGTAPAKLSLTNSSLQDANDIGLYLEGAGLSVSVSNNVLDLASNTWGIEINNPSGTISSNFVSAPANALVYDPSESGVSITYSGNVLRGTTGCAALDLYRPAQVTGNKIDGCTVGIALEAAPIAVTIKTNLIVNATTGMFLACNAVTLSGNTVNNAALGVYDFPGPLSSAQVTFDNVDTVATSVCP